MGPRRTPHKQRDPGNYEALGKVGRRTGATLKDTGVRDEHGFEPVPTFSSPAKSLLQPNGIANDVTNSAEDSMDIDQSTIPEPAELMQSTRTGRISLPPKATSPIKTHLNSSPRRSIAQSVGPLSSPSRNSNGATPTRATSHPLGKKPPNRMLNFSPDRPRESVERSPQSPPISELNKANSASMSGRGRGKGRGKRVFDLTGRGTDYDGSQTDALEGASLPNGIVHDEESILPAGGDQPMASTVFDDDTMELDQTSQQPQETEADIEEPMQHPATTGAKEPKKTRGRAPKPKSVDHNDSQISMPAPEPPRRGRPPRKPQVYQDPDANIPAATSPGPKGKRPASLAPRDPNARSKITKNTHGKAPSRTGSVAAGPRFIQRSETPANDSGALITRYGRQSIKPLATWRGEKTVMGDRTVDTLPGIKEVIRVDEVVEPRPKQRYRKGYYRARSRLADVVEEEEVEEEKAAWELDPGIMVAQVMDWDASNSRYDEENTREEDVAYSFEAIEMRDIKGAEFKFAKTLTLDFFGSGMVQLPPGGAKRIKNSRKMQMVFFVFYGRVTVSIGTPPTKFSIGKGGQWQVPRGNFYSISNESETTDTRIFFAQGCEVQAGAVDESTMA